MNLKDVARWAEKVVKKPRFNLTSSDGRCFVCNKNQVEKTSDMTLGPVKLGICGQCAGLALTGLKLAEAVQKVSKFMGWSEW